MSDTPNLGKLFCSGPITASGWIEADGPSFILSASDPDTANIITFYGLLKLLPPEFRLAVVEYIGDEVADWLSQPDGRNKELVQSVQKWSEMFRKHRRDNPVSDKPNLTGLFRDDPKTPEGKYLVKRRDGSVVEWPNFVLGARDPHAVKALRAYAESCMHDTEIDPEFVLRLFVYAAEWDAYRLAHGEGDPGKGAHRVDDPATIEEMRRGCSA